ncbi:MAG TPA: ISAzo13 family transposase [Chloroflexota bacterium]
MDEDTFLRFFRTLDERQARLCAAERALAVGRGGITLVSRVTGLSYPTIHKGIAELRATAAILPSGRVRRLGGGRKKVEVVDPAVLPVLQEVVESSTAGSPMDVLRWTSKSKTNLAEALAKRGHRMAPNTVGRLLRELGYSLQANRKDKEGRSPPERAAQVAYLNDEARAFLERRQPVISVDAKKKELVGDFKNAGRTWQPKGQPVRVQVHDFPSMSVGKAVPYGIYDVAQNRGFVNVGTSHDTPDFAVESIRVWWEHEGRARYPSADSLLVLADSGGSNSARSRLWKVRLQELADALHIPITVCHLPPGTSKWNKIEHRLFAYISINWRGRPLVDFETIVSLIGATSTTTGLKVTARLDVDAYPTGVKVPDAAMSQLKLESHATYPQWNYTLAPRTA